MENVKKIYIMCRTSQFFTAQSVHCFSEIKDKFLMNA